MKRVLLTGASGFVGSHVLRYILLNTDWFVVCPTTFTHKGLQDRIRFAVNGIDEDFNRVKVISCNLDAPISPITAKEFGNIDYVFNIASQSHVDRSIIEPQPFIMNNVSLMCNLLEWARFTDIEKFLQFSTDEVYGPSKSEMGHKEWDTHLPSNPYSASKSAQESIAYSYWRTYDIPLFITNTMNIIGETQNLEKFVPKIIKSILNKEMVDIHSSNGVIGSRYYLHALNQASALLHIIDRPVVTFKESLLPEKFNIVGEKKISNLDLALQIASIMKKEFLYKKIEGSVIRPGYDIDYALDGTKLKESGWAPEVDFDSSLEQTVLWTLKNKEWLM